MKAYSEIEKQDKMLYEKPTQYTMKDRKNAVYCKNCGHTVEFKTNKDRELCTWCNNFVYKNKSIEFKYKMKGLLK